MGKLSFERGRTPYFFHIHSEATIDRSEVLVAVVLEHTLLPETRRSGYPGPAVGVEHFIPESL
jgi:hypothetical protein